MMRSITTILILFLGGITTSCSPGMRHMDSEYKLDGETALQKFRFNHNPKSILVLYEQINMKEVYPFEESNFSTGVIHFGINDKSGPKAEITIQNVTRNGDKGEILFNRNVFDWRAGDEFVLNFSKNTLMKKKISSNQQ